MTDDAGLKLLAAVEALVTEVRGMREEMLSERESRENLHRLKSQKAVSQKKWRAKSKESVSRESTVVSPETLPPQVLDLDLKQEDQEQELKPAGRVYRESTGILTPLQPKQTGAVWRAYETAFLDRYGVKPVRNQKGNSLIVQLVKRLGEDAAAVAAFYVKHNAAHYAGNGHPLTLLIRDAEKLHMEWQRGHQITLTEARQQERTQANGDSWAKHLVPEGTGT